MERKILAAVDGSVHSRNALRYLGQLFGKETEVNIHLLSVVACANLPAGKDLMDESEIRNVMSQESRRKYSKADRIMAEAVDYLKRHNIAVPRISAEVRLATGGIADFILAEARQGKYDALVIGRRGLGKLEEWIMGSVSGLILEKAAGVPVWIVDGKVDSTRFLVPVDGSPHCLKALDHLAFILQGHPEAEITLFNSQSFFTKNIEVDLDVCYDYWGRKWCRTHFSRPDSLFHAPRQMLIEAGFPEEHIHTLQATMGLYPSRQIVRRALMDEYGTIVMGRREGLYKKGVFKGVSDRVLAMAEEVAIWIV